MSTTLSTYGWATVIVLLRRTVEGFDYPSKLVKAEREEVIDAIHADARVKRFGLVDLLLPTGRGKSAFANLPATPKVVTSFLWTATENGLKDSVVPLIAGSGLVVPLDSLGRCKRDPDLSTGQSILLWSKQRVAPTGYVHGEDISPLVVPTDWAREAGLI